MNNTLWLHEVRFKENMTASILSNHRKIPPYGMAGGTAAITGHNKSSKV